MMARIIAANKSPPDKQKERGDADEPSEVDLFSVNQVCNQLCC